MRDLLFEHYCHHIGVDANGNHQAVTFHMLVPYWPATKGVPTARTIRRYDIKRQSALVLDGSV